jgi:hypothetical protein
LENCQDQNGSSLSFLRWRFKYIFTAANFFYGQDTNMANITSVPFQDGVSRQIFSKMARYKDGGLLGEFFSNSLKFLGKNTRGSPAQG